MPALAPRWHCRLIGIARIEQVQGSASITKPIACSNKTGTRRACRSTGGNRVVISTTSYQALFGSLDRLASCEHDRGHSFSGLFARVRSVELLDERMHDGSRHFALLPQTQSPLRLLFSVFTLVGAIPRGYLPGLIAGSWLDFRYKGYKFSVNHQYGDFWFFVDDPDCPDSLLTKVASHFAKLLQPQNAL
ncbi:MAG: hypothetical protein ABIW82_15285 [Dokdonella sp.]